MNIRIRKILEEIQNGKRKNVLGIKFSIDDYLSKDINGITFLEHLLKHKITIDFFDEKKFGKYSEITYLYCKYNKPLYFFEYTEEDLFKTFEGKRIIDLIVENGQLYSNVVGAIKNNFEIIDIVVKNSIYKLSYINKQLIEKLIIPDKNGNCPMEKYINNNEVIESLLKNINNAELLIDFCKKNNKYEMLKYSNQKVLMHELSSNYTLFDDLYSKNIMPALLTDIPDDLDFVNFLKKRNLYKFLISAREDVLLLKINKEKTLLEELIEKNLLTQINTDIYEEETIQILHKINRLDILANVSITLLNKNVRTILKTNKIDNILLVDYMLDKGYNPIREKMMFEDDLLREMEDGILLIDKFLDKNSDIDFGYCSFKSLELAKKLYENNRIDLLAKGKITTLLNLADEKYTYFDYILENIKNKNIKYNLNDYEIFGYSNKIIAKFYLIIAKHDMIEYVEKLTKDDLLSSKENKTLLEELLDLDADITLNKVLSNSVKSEMEIAILLKSHGLEQNDIDLPLKQSNFANEYLYNHKEKLGIGPLKIEGEFLLRRLKELFDNDGKSDKLLVSVLIGSYREALLVNYDLYIQELRNLVDLKENNPDKLVYLKNEDSSYFRRGRIYCDDIEIDTILHETGHALHYYISNSSVPEDYEIVAEKVRNNPHTLKKVEEFSNEYNKIKTELKKIIEEKYKNFFESYFNNERTNEIEVFLNKSLIDKKEKFKSLGIPEESLNVILNNYFTVDTYIETQKRIFIENYFDAMLSSEYSSYRAIADILDAIYEGEIYSGVLKNDNGELIKKMAGHGISYYSNKIARFNEIIANFSAIAKSKESFKDLPRLKDMIGDELYTMISKYYYDNIVSSNISKIEDIKLL